MGVKKTNISQNQSVIEKKNRIFNQIASAKVFKTGLPKLKKNPSIPSLTNNTNPIPFLSDLIKSLVGYNALIEILANFLTNNVSEIENLIKTSIKTELKSIINCGVNPKLPQFLITNGIEIPVSRIDFFGLFKTDPNSENGGLLYNNITAPLTNSTDLNTFIFGVIQNPNTTYTWNNMLDITFNTNGLNNTNNNSLLIKITSNFTNGNLTQLNNSLINTQKLFDATKIINQIVDLIYGSISSVLNKNNKQLEIENKISDIIDKIIESDENDVIDDSYFSFTNDEIRIQEEKAISRKKGVTKLECCSKVEASIPISLIKKFNNDLTSSTIYNKKEIILSNLNILANQNTLNSDNTTDDTALRLNFIQEIVNNLIKSLIINVISPKVVILLLINFKIIYGEATDFNDPIDFMKLARNIFKRLIKDITKKIVEVLLVVVLKSLAEIGGEIALSKMGERSDNRKSQILSLLGVPDEVLRIIQKLK